MSGPPDRHDMMICTTMVKPGPGFRSWLEYHLRRADRVIVFMDDPRRRPLFEFFTKDERIVLRDGVLDYSAGRTPSDNMNRIMANTQAAIDYALTEGISWLTAVDSDEIFFDNGDHCRHESDSVGQITFCNHEAVPSDHKVVNCFTECTLFRVNGRAEFMAYGNGKSSVRVTPGVRAGIHEFSGYKGEHRTVEHPAILHYPNPSFDSWVAKFTQYEPFSDYWWNNPDDPIRLEFMLRSRDLVRDAIRSGDWNPAREYFASWTIPDAETRRHLLTAGVLRHYEPMAELSSSRYPRS